MSENNKFISWVKAHKTELIIAGVSATAIIGIILGLKNKDAIKELWDALENSLSKTPDKISEPVTIVQTAQPVLEEVNRTLGSDRWGCLAPYAFWFPILHCC